jgi:hypothetical protein
MVLETPKPRELDSCRFLLEGQAKVFADRLYGPDGPPVGTSFTDIEKIVHALGLEFQKQLLDLLLLRQAEAMHRDLAESLRCCPSCKRDTIAQDPEPRLLHSRAGIVEWQEPQRYCKHCRKAFFPQSRMLGIDLGHYSTSLLDLIIYAGANKPSFREASVDLWKMSSQTVHEKQVERLTKRIGLERVAERQAEIDYYVGLPLTARCEETPDGVKALAENQVAVVMVDAGMMQLRHIPEKPGESEESTVLAAMETETFEEDDYDQEKPVGRHWREDKVGRADVMESEVSESDPHPEIPETFINFKRVSKIVRGLKKSAALRADEETEAEPSVESQSSAEAEDTPEKVEYRGPKLVKQRVVASRQSWPIFGVMMACTAWMLGFAKAKRKAFVADGAGAIWRVWQSRFSSYVPILDFIHALSYVYSAAKALGENCGADGWRLYVQWITWVWQGNVVAVIEQLQHRQHELGKPEQGESEATVRSVVAKSLRYLTNNQDKMKYSEYRKQGLPLVSSLVESMVKQISRRVKGTEKFWGEDGAEAILQLRADYLSDGDVMANFWARRQAAATGQRFYRTKK